MQPLWDLMNREIVDRDDVVIFGGNDNCENEDWKPKKARYAPRLALWKDISDSRDSVFLRDEVSGHFAIFSRATGRKIRFMPTGVEAPTAAAVPELVDVKITDYCSAGCNYCYQESTKQGEHASANKIMNFAHECGRRGVFEVAIGGGEPTAHPEFARILRCFRSAGVIPNFSTQSTEWLDDGKILSAVKQCCGAVALSTQSREQAKWWFETMKEHDIRAHVHYVLGVSPLDNLRRMLASTSHGYIVLLAYKQMGRAAGKEPFDYTGWQDVVRKHNKNWWTVAVDTFLVDDVQDGFSRDEVPEHLYESGDGKFSLYWDAVTDSYAAHSFVPSHQRLCYKGRHSYDGSAFKLMEAWERISGVKKQ
jgi:hypothetical protein